MVCCEGTSVCQDSDMCDPCQITVNTAALQRHNTTNTNNHTETGGENKNAVVIRREVASNFLDNEVCARAHVARSHALYDARGSKHQVY